MIRQSDNRLELFLKVDQVDRKQIRVFVINTWLQEAEGQKYRYFVETLANNKRIYLERPARLNKGCDFIIFIEDFNLAQNGNDKPPNHKILFELLNEIKTSSSHKDWETLKNLITCVYNCENIFDGNKYSLEVERVLKLAKWFFIEQDVTYWSYFGRNMLYGELQKKLWQD